MTQFKKLIYLDELKKFGGTYKGSPFSPLLPAAVLETTSTASSRY
jgi:hypothetical protein